MTTILFYILGFIMLAATLLCITRRNPVHAVIYLVAGFFAHVVDPQIGGALDRVLEAYAGTVAAQGPDLEAARPVVETAAFATCATRSGRTRQRAASCAASHSISGGIAASPAAIPGSDHMKAHARVRNPLGRLTTPRDVANVIALLSSDDAAWINGEVIRVDGGLMINGG